VIPNQTKAALAITVIAFAAGIWLFLAPFIVDYQNNWKTLIDATKSNMWRRSPRRHRDPHPPPVPRLRPAGRRS